MCGAKSPAPDTLKTLSVAGSTPHTPLNNNDDILTARKALKCFLLILNKSAGPPAVP